MRVKFSPALGVAIIAVVLACAGGASAASKLITGKDIKNSSITGADIRNGSIGNADIEEGAIGTSRLALSLQDKIDKAGVPGPAGPAGAVGAVGAQGPKGDPGPSALSAANMVIAHMVIGAGQINGGSVGCPSGQRVISGGYFTDSGFAFSDHPSADRNGWTILIDNTDYTTTADLDGYAICAGGGQAVAASVGPRKMLALAGADARQVARRRAAHG